MDDAALMADKKMDAINKLLAMTVGGFGAGVAGNALLNLNEINGEPLTTVSPSSSVPVTLPVRFGQRAQEATKRVRKARRNLTVGSATLKSASLSKLAAAVSKRAEDTGLKAQLASQLPDINGSSITSAPWGIPSLVGLGLASTAGGWQLSSWLRQRQRKKQLQSELSSAEQEYDKALLDQYEGAIAKTASDESNPLPELDELAKSAATWGDRAGQLGGSWATLMLLAGLGGGALGYNYAKQRDPKRLLNKALQARSRARSAPQPIYVVTPPKQIEDNTLKLAEENPMASALPAGSSALSMGPSSPGLGRTALSGLSRMSVGGPAMQMPTMAVAGMAAGTPMSGAQGYIDSLPKPKIPEVGGNVDPNPAKPSAAAANYMQSLGPATSKMPMGGGGGAGLGAKMPSFGGGGGGAPAVSMPQSGGGGIGGVPEADIQGFMTNLMGR